MKSFNFKSQKVYRDIFKPGKIYDLCQAIAEKENYIPFTGDEFAKVPSIFASYDPREVSLLELEDDKIYTSPEGIELFGIDIKKLALTMYNKPRTAYVSFKRNQVQTTSLCGAVPMPLLGFKRYHGIKYNSWNQTNATIKHDTLELQEEEGDLEKAFKIDLLLGKTLASTRYDVKTDSITWKKGFGLQLLGSLNVKMHPTTVYYLREAGMGNYKGHFSTQFGATNVDKHEGIDDVQIDLYNKSTPEMKLLLSQRWAWYCKHRSDDMITDTNDWDKQLEMVDTTANTFVGLKPITEGIKLPKELNI